jgi:hypothetical protein
MRMLGRPLQAVGLVALVAAAFVTLSFDPPTATAAVAGTATPNSGLTDTQTIHVQASGFPPSTNNQPIHVVECVRGATTSQDCEGTTDDPTVNADSSGNYDNPAYTVYVLPDSTIPNASIKCDASHLCDLYVGDDVNNLATSNHVMIPISFAGAAATTTTTPPPPTTTTAPPVGTTTTVPTATTTTAPGATTTTVPGATTTTAAGGSTTTTSTSVVAGTSGGSGSDPSSAALGGSSSGGGTSVSGSGSSQASLPFTAAPPLAPWLGGFGLLAVLGGTVTRRNALRALAEQ